MTSNTLRSLVITLCLTAMVACGPSMSGDPYERRGAAQARLDDALNDYRAGADRATVLGELRSAVEADPEWSVARAAYGNALYAAGDVKAADTQLAWANSQDPNNPLYKYQLGVVRMEQGRYSEAAGFLGEAYRLQPDNADYASALLLAYVQTGRWDRAVQLWGDGAMRQAPKDEQVAIGILLKAVLDREDEAVADAVRARKEFPKNAVFPYLQGLIYEGQTRLEDAIKAYEDAATMQPEDFSIRRLLTVLYLQAGYYRRAEVMIRQYLESPKLKTQVGEEERVQSTFELADAQYQGAKYRLSKRTYGQYRALLTESQSRIGRRLQAKAVGIDPVAHLANGVIDERQGQYPSAITEYRLAIKADPGFLMAYERLGQTLVLQSELSDLKDRRKILEEARDVLEQALEIKRDNPNVYFLLGGVTYQIALLEHGQFRRGLLREALFLFGQAEPGLTDKYAVHIYQGKISDTLEEYAQAAKYYGQAAALRPDQPDVRMLLGHTNLKLKKYPDAVTEFSVALTRGADARDAHMGLALAYERQNLPELADAEFDRADRAASAAAAPSTPVASSAAPVAATEAARAPAGTAPVGVAPAPTTAPPEDG